jgi:hypothetical protein
VNCSVPSTMGKLCFTQHHVRSTSAKYLNCCAEWGGALDVVCPAGLSTLDACRVPPLRSSVEDANPNSPCNSNIGGNRARWC